MTATNYISEDQMQQLREDLLDSLDEELELELDDQFMDRLSGSPSHLNERAHYFRELLRLQSELVMLQDWVVKTGHRMVILFEGRDAAGKGGVIKRITQRLNPRVCRVAALPAPNDREKTQWYFQRYASHLPAAGEIVLFDRSWYNRAGVERVMGFCNDEQYEEFFRTVPEFEKMLVRSGIQVIKYWFSISDEEQHLRFLGRIHSVGAARPFESRPALDLASFGGDPADPFPELDADAGRAALERSEHQFAAVDPVEPGPVELRQELPDQRREVRHVGHPVGLVMDQRTRSLDQVGVKFGLGLVRVGGEIVHPDPIAQSAVAA